MTYRQNPCATSPAPPYCPTKNAPGPYLPTDFRYRLARINAGKVGSEGEVQCAMAYVTDIERCAGREKDSSRNRFSGMSAFPALSACQIAAQVLLAIGETRTTQ